MALLATLASMSGLVKGIGPAFKGIGQVAKKMWADLKVFINDKFIKPLKDALQGIKDWWGGFKESVIEKWQGIKDFISDYVISPIQGMWQGIKDFVSEKVVGPIKEAWNGLKEWFGNFKDFIVQKFLSIKNFIVDKVFDPIKEIWDGFIEKIIGLKDTVFSAFGNIKDTIADVLSKIWNAIPSIPEFLTLDFWIDLVAGIGGAFVGIGDFLIDGMKAGINGIISLINSLFESIAFSKTIDLPGLDPMTIGFDLSSWSIPQLAKGGIVNRPTLAVIGEDGPEAVVPLSQRNNPSGAGMGGGTYNITVNAGGITDRTDKRALAREIGNMIQQELARSVGGTTMRGRY